jgi:hypothetical protein
MTYVKNLFNKCKSELNILHFLFAWAIYAVLYVFFKNNFPIAKGVLGCASLWTLDVMGLFYAFKLWSESKDISKQIYGMILVSFCCILTCDLIYQPLYGILQIPRDNVPASIVIVDHIAYLTCMSLRTIVFGVLVFLSTKSFKNLFTIAYPIIIATIIANIYYALFFNINNGSMAITGFYSTVELMLQLTCLCVAFFCITLNKNRGILYFSLGYILDVITNLVMNAGLLSQAYNISSFAETFWFLDSIFLAYGLFYIYKNKTNQLV